MPTVWAFSRVCDRGQKDAPWGASAPMKRSELPIFQCFQGVPPPFQRNLDPVLSRFERKTEKDGHSCGTCDNTDEAKEGK